MTTITEPRRAQRQKWYDNGPVCPECGENKCAVAEAFIGFAGLKIGYWRLCDSCLPPEVAEESRAIRRAFLGQEVET